MKKVLIVEDDLDTFQLMFEALSTAATAAGVDVNIHHAACRQEMLACMSQQRLDLISLDGQFPNSRGGVIEKKAGLTMLRRLRELGHVGYTFFYSGDDVLVDAAKNVAVAGLAVQSFLKMCVHDEWVKQCILCLKD